MTTTIATKPTPRRHNRAKLEISDVIAIRRALADGYTQAALAEAFDVCAATVSHIATRRWWAHVA